MSLTESIAELKDYNFGHRHWSRQFSLYLDPEAQSVYVHESIGGNDMPMAAFHGLHLHVADIPAGAIAASVAEQVEQIKPSLVAICDRYQGSHYDYERNRPVADWRGDPYDLGIYFQLEIASQWDPADWFAPVLRDIDRLHWLGESAASIVDTVGIDDDQYQVVDRDEAIAWVGRYVEDLPPGCHECRNHGVGSAATTKAVWRDGCHGSDQASDTVFDVCDECLCAGDATGQGYHAVEDCEVAS